jgi:hypothetical protein
MAAAASCHTVVLLCLGREADDHRCSGDGDAGFNNVRQTVSLFLYEPPPYKRRHDVDAARGGVGSACKHRVDSSERNSEHNQTARTDHCCDLSRVSNVLISGDIVVVIVVFSL